MEQLTPDDRIAAQEKALDAVNCELALMRQHMDARFAATREATDAQFAAMRESTDAQFAAMRESTDAQFVAMRESINAQFVAMRESTNAQFAAMRQYVDDGFAKLRLEMQLYTRDEIAKAIAPLQAQIDDLRNHVDRISRWGFGMLATILASQVALAAFSLLR